MVISLVLLILVMWAACAGLLIGVGSIVLGWFRLKYSIIDSFWIGLALSVGILQIWHLFEPVDLTVDLLLVCIGALGFVRNRSRLLTMLRQTGEIGFSAIGIYFLVVLSLAFRAIGPCEHFDTGLYGATAVRWIVTYPVVPGLANLHGRLGFNSSVFLCVAALGQGLWRNAGHHLFHGLLVSGFWATIAGGTVRVFRARTTSATDWFHAILVIPCTYWTTHARVVGTMTDLPATIVCLVATGILVKEFEDARSAENGTTEVTPNIAIAMILLALAITFKLSISVFAGLLWVTGLVLHLQFARPSKLRFKLISFAITISIILILGWASRGIILSGYPFYPQSFGGIDVNWKASILSCKWMIAWIRSWARTPMADLADTQGYHWIGGWIRRSILGREEFQIPVGLTLIGGIGFLISERPKKGHRWLFLLIPAVVSLIFWFIQAPAPRFAEAALWTTAAILSIAAISGIMSANKNPWLPRTFCLAIVLIAAWCTAPHRLLSYVYLPLLRSGEPLTMPKARVVPTKTTSGLVVFWRRNGQQCWDAPLPCTPYYDKTLRLRQEGDMRRGFDSDAPGSFSDLRLLWAPPNCPVDDASCLSQSKEASDFDHGGE